LQANKFISMKNTIKNIIFDFGGVVFQIEEQRTVNAFADLFHCSAQEVLKHLFTDDAFLQFECGKISPQDFMQHLRNISSVNFTEEQFLSAWNAILVGYPAEHIPLLLALKKKYRTFLLSNTNELHTKEFGNIAKRQNLPIQSNEDLFEKVYYSNELKLRKPDTKIYQYVLNDAGLKAEETMFVDDLLVNVEAAATLGIHIQQITKEQGIMQIFADWI